MTSQWVGQWHSGLLLTMRGLYGLPVEERIAAALEFVGKPVDVITRDRTFSGHALCVATVERGAAVIVLDLDVPRACLHGVPLSQVKRIEELAAPVRLRPCCDAPAADGRHSEGCALWAVLGVLCRCDDDTPEGSR